MDCRNRLDCVWAGGVDCDLMIVRYWDVAVPEGPDYFLGESCVTTTTPASVTGKR
jgi:hypothetical protein